MRLSIAQVDGDQHVTMLETVRESVRLGQDVFTRGYITDETIERALEAFRRFRETIDRHGASWVRAVATSATREALNKDLFLDRIEQTARIAVAPIGPEEEARLVHMAVKEKVNLKGKVALLVDIGGGSTEITLTNDATILSTESYRMGSVRLLQLLEGKRGDERQLHRMVQEYVDATQKRVTREIGSRKIGLCIGTGGNIDTLGDLRRQLLGKEKDSVLTLDDLDVLLRKMQAMTYEERVQQLGLRPDRADVIIPAAIITRKILKLAGVDELIIPRVGLKDGLLVDMIQELYGDKKRLNRDQVLSSALELGRKFSFDEQHGTTVARLALELFDQTRGLHHLGLDHRLLLEAAALLHDIGTFVSATDHHKHTQYLLMASPVIGLTQDQMAIIANIARYHRKSMPKPQHEYYRMLSSKERVVVSKLSALLRLADALDNEHASKVAEVMLEWKKPKLILRMRGEGDLLLEKWAVMKKADMVEEVFGVKLAIEE
jgi:exopolyphosphatase/guanosine-5'-triphosphate,3'-diphosphate pyrophosphatase